MLKYHDSPWKKVVLLTSAYLLLFSHLTYATTRARENTLDENDQFREQMISTSSENHATPLGSGKTKRQNRANCTRFLSLTVSSSKIHLIQQKEIELQNNYSDFAEYPKQSGHHWDLSELSDREAVNVCYSLWLGLTFSEIEEINKSDLSPQLYAYCGKFQKIPIRDIHDNGRSAFCYNVGYPYKEKQFKCTPHRISVLKCVCTFTGGPKRKHTSNDSKRCFFAHKFKDNEYLILSPMFKERYLYRDLKIIDVQKVDHNGLHLEDKRIIPISTHQILGYTDNEFDDNEHQSTSSHNENQAIASTSRIVGRCPKTRRRADCPMYLSLTVPQSKIDLIIQKENEMKNNYDNLMPMSPAHIWNMCELSENEAVNVCYTLWLGLKFSDIGEIDKSYLPSRLYSYCQYKKYPIRDNYDYTFCYKIVYPYTEKDLQMRHQIGVLQCVCRFTESPKSRYISNESNRKFFVHKSHYNDYLILSPISKEPNHHCNLGIIDIQRVNPISFHTGDKRSIPISTN